MINLQSKKKVEAWRNVVEDSALSTIDIFDQDELIGTDIANLFKEEKDDKY